MGSIPRRRLRLRDRQEENQLGWIMVQDAQGLSPIPNPNPRGLSPIPNPNPNPRGLSPIPNRKALIDLLAAP